MFDFFKKREKEYIDAQFRIFRYRSPKLSLGNNIIGNKNKIIRLKDIIVHEVDGMCKLDDDGLIGYSPMFENSILDNPLICEYGYMMRHDGIENKFFKTLEECLEYHFKSVDIYMNQYKSYSIDECVSILNYIDKPIILRFMMDKYVPIFINDNYEIFKNNENRLMGYHSIGMNSFMNALPKVYYGSFYINTDRIAHSISEELLTMEIIETKSAPYKSYGNIPKDCFESNGFVFYKEDIIQYSNYKEYLRLNKSFIRDRKIESLLN